MGLPHGALIWDFSIAYAGWKNATIVKTVEPNQKDP